MERSMKLKHGHLPRVRELVMEDGYKPLAQASGYLTNNGLQMGAVALSIGREKTHPVNGIESVMALSLRLDRNLLITLSNPLFAPGQLC
jgi:hypothetical protein